MMSNLIPWTRNQKQRNASAANMAPFSQMRLDWDRLFDRVLDDAWSPWAGTSIGMPLDLAETDDEIRVRAEVPGIEPKELAISLAGEILTISGEKSDEQESRDESRSWSERSFGAFQRSVRLPCPVDPDRVRAEHKNGVVTITLQKAEAVRPKRIAVKSA